MQPAYRFFSSVQFRIVDFLITQWCLMLISWPILLSWGLPTAALSPLGNCLFVPFLTIFLVLATGISLLTLLGFSSWPLTIILEQLTHLWFWVMECTPWSWNIVMPKPPLLLMLFVPLGTIGIMHFIPFRAKPKRCFLALMLFSIFIFFLLSQRPLPQNIQIPWGSQNKIPIVLTQKGELVAYDGGFLRRNRNIASWVMYTLLPTLATTFGKQQIDCYHLRKITPSTVKYLQFLCEKRVVKSIQLPPETSKREWTLMRNLVQFAVQNDIKIERGG